MFYIPKIIYHSYNNVTFRCCSPADDGIPKYTCLCSDGYDLHSDGESCHRRMIPTTLNRNSHPSSSPPSVRSSHVAAADSVNVGTIAAISSSVVFLIAVLAGVVSG